MKETKIWTKVCIVFYTLTLGGLVSWFQFVASEELDVNIKDSENPIKMK